MVVRGGGGGGPLVHGASSRGCPPGQLGPPTRTPPTAAATAAGTRPRGGRLAAAGCPPGPAAPLAGPAPRRPALQGATLLRPIPPVAPARPEVTLELLVLLGCVVRIKVALHCAARRLIQLLLGLLL